MGGNASAAVAFVLLASASLGSAGSPPATPVTAVAWTADEAALDPFRAQVLERYGAFLLVEVDAPDVAPLSHAVPLERVDLSIRKGGGSTVCDASAVGPSADAPSIVQFIGPVKPEWVDWLDAWSTVLDYVPHNAFVVLPDAGASPQAAPFVRCSMAYGPAHRTQAPGAPAALVDLQLWSAADLEPTVLSILSGGGDVLEATGVDEPYLRVRPGPGGAAGLASLPGVAWIEPVRQALPLDNSEAAWVVQSGRPPHDGPDGPLWAAQGPDGRSLHARGLDGRGQLVAVADEGLDSGPDGRFLHEAFDDPSHGPFEFGAPGSAHRKVAAYLPLNESGVVKGDHAGGLHGTHTAGTVAGDAPGDGGYGTYGGLDGQAFASRLVVLDLQRNGTFSLPLDYQNVFGPAFEAGARIHVNAYGYPFDPTYTLRARQNDAFAHAHPDFLIVRSMGNSDGPGMRPEAAAKDVLSVGASGNGAQAQDLFERSGRGPAADGRVKPTLVAPGIDVQSSVPGGYAALSGTSMASAVAGGTAALLRQYFEEGWHAGGAAQPSQGFPPSSALLRAALIASAEPIHGLFTGGPGSAGSPGCPDAACAAAGWPNGAMGWGLPRLEGALRFEGSPVGLWVRDGEGVSTGEVYEQTVRVADPGQGLKVVLAWTDPPAAAGSDPALVDDLDLRVLLPDGTELKGNVFAGAPGADSSPSLPSGQGVRPSSAPGGSADRLNVEEVVALGVAPPGDYRIQVIGFNVPGARPVQGDPPCAPGGSAPAGGGEGLAHHPCRRGTQRFALVAAGGLAPLHPT